MSEEEAMVEQQIKVGDRVTWKGERKAGSPLDPIGFRNCLVLELCEAGGEPVARIHVGDGKVIGARLSDLQLPE